MDFNIVDGGSVFLLIPNTEAANAWVDEHLPESLLTFGKGIAVEARYIQQIVYGIVEDGLSVA